MTVKGIRLTTKLGPIDNRWPLSISFMHSSVVMWSSVASSRTPHRMSTTCQPINHSPSHFIQTNQTSMKTSKIILEILICVFLCCTLSVLGRQLPSKFFKVFPLKCLCKLPMREIQHIKHTHTHIYKYRENWFIFPVNVELVKIRTILELTEGKVPNEPAKIRSTVTLLEYCSRFYDYIVHKMISKNICSQ